MRSFNLGAAIAATFSVCLAVSCNSTTKCPESAPCCSQYGVCGVGAYCLGGCDPRYSYDFHSCLAAPACKNSLYEFKSLSKFASNTEYLGDSNGTDWVISGTPVIYNNDSVLLTMAEGTVGTLLMSTHYVWYGKISASLTTSQGQGVVTAFILMSDTHDEIDFEFVGADVSNAQSNYYSQGIEDWHNEKHLAVPGGDSRQEVHTYTIDWQPDYISWFIDGQQLRTKFRNETYNSTTQKYAFPQTPSRVMLSLWPAGAAGNRQGTIDWAGGLVNWNSPYMQNGYYYAIAHNVSVECYNPPAGAGSGNAYFYKSVEIDENSVALGNNGTSIRSLGATGDNPQPEGTVDSANSVPGVFGAGNIGSDGNSNGRASPNPNGGFQQGDLGGTSQASKVVAGGAVALFGLFVACLL
ncbi:glycoside hydrolase family 16 protein [Piedraia hortae CBS 480.64]|uniref:Glycoside hydrolase family 16 protein n=1 Tax=Piedraia hortae CBS 480.64 TaxID=1314780 RepID=A0A6A7BWC1_9PEZI|nr:glycoside hydrolase family 16 protein [Piedraia hortae CBS 480.64]